MGFYFSACLSAFLFFRFATQQYHTPSLTEFTVGRPTGLINDTDQSNKCRQTHCFDGIEYT